MRWSRTNATAMAQRARARPVQLTERLATLGSHREVSSGWVPDMEATPGRFHGPKMSHRVTPRATKLRPRPEKISCTRPNTRNSPASSAHSAPPSMAAPMASAIWSTPPSSTGLRAAVQKIAPMITCPSTPMFHSRAVNGMSSPTEHRVRGTQTESTRPNLDRDPRPPWNRTKMVLSGGAPAGRVTSTVSSRASPTAARNQPVWTSRDSRFMPPPCPGFRRRACPP